MLLFILSYDFFQFEAVILQLILHYWMTSFVSTEPSSINYVANIATQNSLINSLIGTFQRCFSQLGEVHTADINTPAFGSCK